MKYQALLILLLIQLFILVECYSQPRITDSIISKAKAAYPNYRSFEIIDSFDNVYYLIKENNISGMDSPILLYNLVTDKFSKFDFLGNVLVSGRFVSIDYINSPLIELVGRTNVGNGSLTLYSQDGHLLLESNYYDGYHEYNGLSVIMKHIQDYNESIPFKLLDIIKKNKYNHEFSQIYHNNHLDIDYEYDVKQKKYPFMETLTT